MASPVTLKLKAEEALESPEQSLDAAASSESTSTICLKLTNQKTNAPEDVDPSDKGRCCRDAIASRDETGDVVLSDAVAMATISSATTISSLILMYIFDISCTIIAATRTTGRG